MSIRAFFCLDGHRPSARRAIRPSLCKGTDRQVRLLEIVRWICYGSGLTQAIGRLLEGLDRLVADPRKGIVLQRFGDLGVC